MYWTVTCPHLLQDFVYLFSSEYFNCFLKCELLKVWCPVKVTQLRLKINIRSSDSLRLRNWFMLKIWNGKNMYGSFRRSQRGHIIIHSSWLLCWNGTSCRVPSPYFYLKRTQRVLHLQGKDDSKRERKRGMTERIQHLNKVRPAEKDGEWNSIGAEKMTRHDDRET